MNKKLDHRIIVLTGGIASGKTTVKQKLIGILDAIKVPYMEISGIRDLYIPFAIKKGLLIEKESYQRIEIVRLMETMYAQYGKTLGTQLLYDFLVHKPSNQLYIIDSKRNPSGIRKLRALCHNVYVIATYATFFERVTRYKRRKRHFDAINGMQQEPLPVFKREEDIFKISKTVSNANLIIENHTITPFDIETSLFKGLAEKGYLAVGLEPAPIFLPEKDHGEKTNNSLLKAEDIPALLDAFIAQNKRKRIFIIQGGNRYIKSYIDQFIKKKVRSVKLLCLSKSSLAVVLLTPLSVNERVSSLSYTQREKVFNAFEKLSAKKRREYIKKINQVGFSGVKDFLRYGSREEMIEMFADRMICTPFLYPANDHNIKKEFAKIFSFARDAITDLEEKWMIKILLVNTEFYSALNDAGQKSVFLDDVFYRGRTFYTLLVITGILDIPISRWKLYTLCSDRVSNSIVTEHIRVLKRGVLYPFENNIIAEKGYWDEANNHFVFRDLVVYERYLTLMIGTGHDVEAVQGAWENLLRELTKKVAHKKLSLPVVTALIKLYLFYAAHHLKMDFEAIEDQRANRLGYCIPFVQVVSTWMNQAEPRWKRQTYKDLALSCLKKISALLYKSPILNDAITFYRKNNLLLDYVFLKQIGHVGKRECEIKYLITNNEEERIKAVLRKNRFVPEIEQLETDFIPDTPEFLCRQSSLLLRFRRIQSSQKDDILLTLKVEKTTIHGFQDAQELEYYFSDVKRNIFYNINLILQKTIRRKLPDTIHTFRDLNKLRAYLATIGFPSLRTLIGKKRTRYSKNTIAVTFDIFPNKIGKYMEIETKTPESLKKMVALLKIPQENIEIRDYGDIVRAKKEGFSEEEKRTTLF